MLSNLWGQGTGSRMNRARARTTGRKARIQPDNLSVPHYVDIGATNLACDTTQSKLLLNPICRGDDVSERNSRSVRLHSCEVFGDLFTATATGVSQLVRLLVIYDVDPAGTAININNVLSSNAINALQAPDNAYRYKLLYDKCFSVEPRTGKGCIAVRIKLNLRGLSMKFNLGDAGSIADIQKGSLYLYAMGDQGAGNTAATIGVYTRVTFTDE